MMKTLDICRAHAPLPSIPSAQDWNCTVGFPHCRMRVKGWKPAYRYVGAVRADHVTEASV